MHDGFHAPMIGEMNITIYVLYNNTTYRANIEVTKGTLQSGMNLTVTAQNDDGTEVDPADTHLIGGITAAALKILVS